MRKALFIGNPPIDWFVSSALIYDKVKIKTGVFEQDASAYANLYNIFPEPIRSEHFQAHNYFHDVCYNPAVDFVESDALYVDFTLPNPFEASNPDVDFYYSNDGKNPCPVQATLFKAVQMLTPLDSSKISISQIIDFRAQNELRRVRFQNVGEQLVLSFGSVSTEEEAQRVLRLVEQSLEEEYKKLEAIYRHTKIETATKTIQTLGSPPALLAVLGSVLHITCVAAAGLIASTAVSIVPWLLAREKAKMTLNDSPWAYIWYLTHLTPK